MALNYELQIVCLLWLKVNLSAELPALWKTKPLVPIFRNGNEPYSTKFLLGNNKNSSVSAKK